MKKKPKVFFNASVILAGLYSPKGGSAKVLKWSKQENIDGYISEVVLDEAKRHANKIKISQYRLERKVQELVKITPPVQTINKKYKKLVVDVGDIHLFTSSESLNVDYLISLDKKHVLSLSSKLQDFKIVTPGEFIIEYYKKL